MDCGRMIAIFKEDHTYLQEAHQGQGAYHPQSERCETLFLELWI